MNNQITINLDRLTAEQLITLGRILYTAGTVEDVKKVNRKLAEFLENEEQ